jgi:Ca-activated chloride channel family protein
MKFVVLILLTMITIDPSKIARINTAKSEAREAYVEGDYKTAVSRYKYLSDSLDVKEDEVMINLANSFFHVKDTANAMSTYQSLTASPKDHIRSKAHQQLGILQHQQGKFPEALANFKEAIKADNNNVDAKYNYEALKRKLDEEKKKQEEKEKNRPKEPSAFAKRLKAQADNLAAGFKFLEAEKLMSDGAKKDPSVLYYEDFINRLKEIVTIDKSK